MKKILTIFSLVCALSSANAQLANGSIAPNFTLTDINGVQHTLYQYLDAGKTVYIDFFATHCPYCWAYKNTGAMKALYEMYGPTGTQNQDVVVMAIELDPNNGLNELNGTSGYTQGNWIAGIPYPIINPEQSERTEIISNYAANYYPLIYGICPDRTIRVLGSRPTAALYNYHVQSCSIAGIDEEEDASLNIHYNPSLKTIALTGQQQGELVITDLSGNTIVHLQEFTEETKIDAAFIPNGVYLFTLNENGLIRRGKVVVY